jgi:hypothetical protein
VPLSAPQGTLHHADMAESSSPPSSAAAPALEAGITEQPGPRSPTPSPPGLEEPLDGADPDVPHPDLAPVAFFCLRQTTSPRNWCIKMVCNPYPLAAWARPSQRPLVGEETLLMSPICSYCPLAREPEAVVRLGLCDGEWELVVGLGRCKGTKHAPELLLG